MNHEPPITLGISLVRHGRFTRRADRTERVLDRIVAHLAAARAELGRTTCLRAHPDPRRGPGRPATGRRAVGDGQPGGQRHGARRLCRERGMGDVRRRRPHGATAPTGPSRPRCAQRPAALAAASRRERPWPGGRIPVPQRAPRKACCSWACTARSGWSRA